MGRVSLKASLVMLIMCVAPAGFTADHAAGGPERVPAVISKLHHLDWSRVRPEELESLTGLSFKTQVLKSPDTTEACSETTYLTAGSASGGLMTMEFSSSPHGDKCRLSMYAVTFEKTMSHMDAQLERSAFVRQLKPGGTDGCDSQTSTYAWRSLNSRVRFNLEIAVKPQAVDVDPFTPTKFAMRLTHTNVESLSVDHLPFEKGVLINDRPDERPSSSKHTH